MTAAPARLPAAWPGIVLSGFSAGLAAKMLLDLYNGTDVGSQLVYPEYFLAPLLVTWILYVFRLHRYLAITSQKQYAITPRKALLWAIFAGPAGYWLAGTMMQLVGRVIAPLLFNAAANSAALDEMVNSWGVIALAGSVILTYISAATLIAVSTWKLIGKLTKYTNEKNDKLKVHRFTYKAILTLALALPGFIGVANTYGTYKLFVAFVLLQCLGYLAAFVCLNRLGAALAR